METRSHKGFWEVLLLGIVFALAFCHTAVVLYFGMLIPMTISSASDFIMPLFLLWQRNTCNHIRLAYCLFC
jgi:hypothetical protein